MNVKTQALQAARAVWPALAHASGRDPEAYDVTLVSARSEGEGRARVVAVAQAHERIVIKFRVGGKPGEDVQAAQAHRSAIEILADMPDCAAPEIIATDTGTGAMALSWVEGATLRDVFASDPGAVRPVMGHAGRWMAALHRRGPVDFVPFKGDWMLRRLDRMAQQGVAAAPEFAACRAALSKLSDVVRDRAMPKAMIHGDLTLSNLMWDGRVLTGIDFENTGQHPVARDAAMLLCDVAVAFGCASQVPAGGVVPEDVMTSFLDGLGLDAPDSDILRFFIGLRLLQIWTGVPRRVAERTVRRAREFRAVKVAAARALLE